MKDCAGKGASMATKLKKIIPKEIAPAKPMDWKGFNPLASTVEVSEQLSLADEERTKAVIRAIKSGEIDGPVPEFNPDNFKLGEFLECPLGVLGIPYGKLTSDFLALMLNLETLYKELNQDHKYGGFDVEIQKFEDEIPLQKNKKTHPFWTCGGHFGAIASCYLDCVFGLKYSRLDSDHNQALNHYASASRITGWLESQAGIDWEAIKRQGAHEKLGGGRKKGTYGTIKTEILEQLKKDPNIKSAQLFRKFFNQTTGVVTGGRTYEGEVLLYDSGSSIPLSVFRSRVSEVKNDLKKITS